MNKKIFILLGTIVSTAAFATTTITETCPSDPKGAVSSGNWTTKNSDLAASNKVYTFSKVSIETINDQNYKPVKYDVICYYDRFSLSIVKSFVVKITPATSVPNPNPSLPGKMISWYDLYKGSNKVQTCISDVIDECAWSMQLATANSLRNN